MYHSTYPSNPNYLQRVRRLSGAMVWVCRVLMLVLPLALVAYWASASTDQLAAQGNLPAAALLAPVLAWQRVAAALVHGVPLVLLLLGVWQSHQCFASFAQGHVFTAQATAHLRRFAGWVAAAALAAIVASAMTSVLLTLHNPPGARHLALGLSSNHVVTFFFAAVVWLMAEVIRQGQELAEENARFV